MYSTFHGLEVGKRAILASQTALSTTGHNIANANTPGYSRQEAVIASSRPLAYPSMNNGTTPMQIGMGVEVAQIRRIRDDYLDHQFRHEQQKAGYWEAKASSLANLESVFNETSSSGLNMEINRLWQSFEELAKQPDNLALRTIVVANGKSVSDTINQMAKDLDLQQQLLAEQMNTNANQVNNIVKEIAELNSQITKVVGSGNQPNDLYDKRDLLLDQLSKLANVQVQPTQNGGIDLSIGGVKLLNGTQISELQLNQDKNGFVIGEQVVVVDGGTLKGLLETNNSTVSTLKVNLDSLAQAIAKSLNEIHASPEALSLHDIQNLNEDPTATPERLLFYVDKDDPTQPPSSAANMIINPLLLNAPAKLAAATSDKTGDGSNTTAMANALFGKINIDGTSTTITDFYKSVLTKLGTDAHIARRWSDNANATAQQMDYQRQSVSGVSLDEELTNMIRYQQAYNAAARYVSVVNDMLDKLINGMR